MVYDQYNGGFSLLWKEATNTYLHRADGIPHSTEHSPQHWWHPWWHPEEHVKLRVLRSCFAWKHSRKRLGSWDLVDLVTSHMKLGFLDYILHKNKNIQVLQTLEATIPKPFWYPLGFWLFFSPSQACYWFYAHGCPPQCLSFCSRLHACRYEPFLAQHQVVLAGLLSCQECRPCTFRHISH